MCNISRLLSQAHCPRPEGSSTWALRCTRPLRSGACRVLKRCLFATFRSMPSSQEDSASYARLWGMVGQEDLVSEHMDIGSTQSWFAQAIICCVVGFRGTRGCILAGTDEPGEGCGEAA